METCKKDSEGRVVLHPELADLILQINKLLEEAKKTNKKVLDLIGKE